MAGYLCFKQTLGLKEAQMLDCCGQEVLILRKERMCLPPAKFLDRKEK